MISSLIYYTALAEKWAGFFIGGFFSCLLYFILLFLFLFFFPFLSFYFIIFFLQAILGFGRHQSAFLSQSV